MRKSTLKRGMRTFAGCAVGERRSGWLKSAAGIEVYHALAAMGYLTSVEEGNRVWFALTPTGKAYTEKYFEKC